MPNNNSLVPDRSRADSNWGLFLRAATPTVRLLISPQTLSQLPRLFSEGLAPARRLFVQAHNQREIRRWIKEGSPVNFVSSFPRSGNVWIRNLLADVLLQSRGLETETELAIPTTEVIPDFYSEFITRGNDPSGLVKTHDLFEQLRARFWPDNAEAGRRSNGGSGPSNFKIIHLYRTPEDSLVSFFHFQRNVRFVKQTNLGIDDFCRAELSRWIKHMESYLRAQNEGTPVFFVSYEKLLNEPEIMLFDILRAMEIKHSVPMVERAVANMEFKKLRAVAEKSTPGVGESFWRRGGNGAGMAELKPETLHEIREKTAALIHQADERIAQQRSEPIHRPERVASSPISAVDAVMPSSHLRPI